MNTYRLIALLLVPLFLTACGGGGGAAINAAPSTSNTATDILQKTSSGKTSADSPTAPASSTDSESSAAAGAPGTQSQSIGSVSPGIQVFDLPPVSTQTQQPADQQQVTDQPAEPQTDQPADQQQVVDQPTEPQTDQPTEPQTDQQPQQQVVQQQVPVQTGTLDNGNEIPLRYQLRESDTATTNVRLSVSSAGRLVTFRAPGGFVKSLCVPRDRGGEHCNSGSFNTPTFNTPTIEYTREQTQRVRYANRGSFQTQVRAEFSSSADQHISARGEKVKIRNRRWENNRWVLGTFHDWSIARFGKPSYDGEHGSHWNTRKSRSHTLWAPCTPTTCTEGQTSRITGFRTVSTYTYKTGIDRWFVAAKRDPGTNNYRSFGYWLEYDMEADSAGQTAQRWLAKPTNIEYRIFSAGSEAARNMASVRAGTTATYHGESAGIMQWNQDNARRVSTFDGAPTTFTANFDTMKINGRVDIDAHGGVNYYHTPDGGYRSTDRTVDPVTGIAANNTVKDNLADWLARGVAVIRFSDGTINNDGSFTNVGVHVTSNASRTYNAGSGTHSGTEAPDPSSSQMSGQFYQPSGANAPGSVLGTFYVSSQAGNYDVRGAFGAERH